MAIAMRAIIMTVIATLRTAINITVIIIVAITVTVTVTKRA